MGHSANEGKKRQLYIFITCFSYKLKQVKVYFFFYFYYSHTQCLKLRINQQTWYCIDESQKQSLICKNSLKIQLQEFRRQSGEILRLSPDANFCISKNMALFFYVFRIELCFWKCKFIKLEAGLKFHPRQLRLQNQIFFINPEFLHHSSSFCLHLSEMLIIFHAKTSLMKMNKPISSLKNHHLMTLRIVQKICWLIKFCLRLYCDMRKYQLVYWGTYQYHLISHYHCCMFEKRIFFNFFLKMNVDVTYWIVSEVTATNKRWWVLLRRLVSNFI